MEYLLVFLGYAYFLGGYLTNISYINKWGYAPSRWYYLWVQIFWPMWILVDWLEERLKQW